MVSGAGIALKIIPSILALPRGEAGKQLPITVQAQSMRGRPDIEMVAEGDAVLRRGELSIRADLLSYDQVEDLALARGNVQIRQEGNRYGGPELQIKVQRFEGYFIKPTYFFGRTGAGGVAERIDFIDNQRSVATNTTYSSCPADGGDRAWELSTSRVKMDFEANEGVAENAVLRFLGVPILASPVLRFPLTDERKSGWLPPSIAIDSRTGLQVQMPWYWNIAPNRDATLTPLLSSKRGVGLGTEFRYLEPNYRGQLNLDFLPDDRVAGRSRYSYGIRHEMLLEDHTEVKVRALRVSDDNYWKDFRQESNPDQITPRLLLSDIRATRPFGNWTTYARVQSWQVLQNPDSRFETPYERLPQVGARIVQPLDYGLELGFEGEFNHFVNPAGNITPNRVEGSRLHSLASISMPWLNPGWSVTPKIALNAASYSLDRPMADGRSEASRVIPTFSVDGGMVLERDTSWFGHDLRQTLEPRLLYTNTPYHRQDGLPNFDSAAKDVNFESSFSQNTFSGVDRVSDANQVTAGVTTRLLDPRTEGELMRLAMVQSYLFSDQRITPDGKPLTRRVSDLLLLGSTNLIPQWTLNGSMQYRPDLGRSARSTFGASYSPGPFRTLAFNYRFTRDQSEEVELGWQWPLFGRTPDQAAAATGQGSCRGSLYTVGRANYSPRDRRLIDALLGFEYDAGCWIGRIVAERQSTGQTEATTRFMIQLELVGLSRIGSNPLQALQHNVPGYRLLRDGPLAPQTSSIYD